MATFTKVNGEWAVIGPVGEIGEGHDVDVRLKSGGSKRVTIARTSKPFAGKFGPYKGMQVCFGWPVKDSGRTPTSARTMCAECDERPGTRYALDSNGIRDLVCPRCAAQPAYCRSYA